MAAGIYAARKKINALLLTKSVGGQSIVSAKIENVIGLNSLSGEELSNIFENQLKSYPNLELETGISVESIKKIEDVFEIKDSSGNSYQANYVLNAMGSGYRKLGVPGEKEFGGEGVFYCSTCDAPLMKNKIAAVIGGGNSGFNAVIDLLPYASEIYLLEAAGQLRGDPILQDKIKNERVRVILNAKVLEISGSGLVNGLKYLDLAANEEKFLNLSGIFVEIGYEPNTELVNGMVNLNEKRQIIVDHKTMRTSIDGMWAAGDITDGLYNQINTAIGDGIKAILNIYDTIKSRSEKDKILEPIN